MSDTLCLICWTPLRGAVAFAMFNCARPVMPSFEEVIDHQHSDGYWKPTVEPILIKFFEGEEMHDPDMKSEVEKGA